MKLTKKGKEIFKEYEKYKIQKEDPSRLLAEDGSFVSAFPGYDGDSCSIGFLEELCEYVHFYSDKSDQEKLDDIIAMEELICKLLGGSYKMTINYIPTWSIAQKKKMGIKIEGDGRIVCNREIE